MQADFWQQRWREGRIGFHQPEVNRLLQRHWTDLALAADSRVFVPLCGKSVDLAWLAGLGHRVFGVELVESAIVDFFAEQGLQPERVERTPFVQYRAGAIELWAGDAFALTAEDLADCHGVYDRAALIALPPELRQRYVDELYSRLPLGCRGLLITLDYPQAERDGPPFSVDADELRQRFEPRWRLDQRERVDILAREPSFQAEGVSQLHTSAWALQRQL